MKSPEACDVMVIGGGLVGAATALALCGCGLKLALVETASPPALPVAEWDSRMYAISPGNVAWLERLGAWQGLDPARVALVDEMHVWGDDGIARLDFSAYEAHVVTLGSIVESSRLRYALWARLAEAAEVRRIDHARCVALHWKDDGATLELAGGQRLSARLVIGADGGNSWVRSQAGIRTETEDYGQMGVVANFETDEPHGNIARQWFRGDNILAWLPLPGKRISMVWSTPVAHARTLLALAPEALAACVGEAGGRALGTLRLITAPAAFPLCAQRAETLVGPRLALVGDAAHRVHPMAGQGVNLGFQDAAALAALLRGRGRAQDVGDEGLLRRYARARKLDVALMQGLTGGLHGLFRSQWPGMGRLRNFGLALTHRQGWLKRRLVAHAMGRGQGEG